MSDISSIDNALKNAQSQSEKIAIVEAILNIFADNDISVMSNMSLQKPKKNNPIELKGCKNILVMNNNDFDFDYIRMGDL